MYILFNLMLLDSVHRQENNLKTISK